MDRKEKFIAALTVLSNEYRCVIGGCGCCGSPYVDEEGNPGEYTYKEDGYPELEWAETRDD